MIPYSFDYHDPESIEEAFALLHEHGDDGKLMAGGQSLLPMMKFRLVSPAHVVDLWRVRGHNEIGESGDEIRIGALATHRTLEDSDLLQSRCPILAKAAGCVGDVQVRNMGTVGGSISHADPAANYSPVLIALGAKFVLRSKGGERVVAAADFYKGMFSTVLQPTEMLVEVRVPVLGEDNSWEYSKISRRAQDFALIGVAVILRRNEKGECADASIVLGSVGPTPVRMDGVEKALRGKALNSASIEAGARATALGKDVSSDVHADAAYRKEVAPVCVRRALDAAVARMTAGRK
jgi:aerobic carbon-monoxide dehydrogenase medium subunit